MAGFYPGVGVVTSTTGTGDYAIDGAITGYGAALLDLVPDGSVITYRATNSVQVEIGTGTYDAVTDTLTRDTIIFPVSGLPVDWPAGRKFLYLEVGSDITSFTGILPGANGGTGVANTGKTITLGGNLTLSGAFATTLTIAGTTNASLPTGTHTLAGLDVAQTWSADQQFNSGNFKLKGSTSGTLTIKPAAAAGSNTLTLPAGTTDLSATGGTSQVLKQTSAGGPITVGQLTFSDIAAGSLPGGGSIDSSGLVGLGGAPTANGETLAVWASGTTTGLRVFNTAAPGANSGAGVNMLVNAVPSAADQRLGFLAFGAIRTGTTYNFSAGVIGYSAEGWSSSAAGAYLTFETAAAGATARTERGCLYQSGEWGFGTRQTSPPATAFVARSSTTTYSAGASVLPRLSLLNTNTTDNNVSQLDFATTDAGGTNTASAKIFGRHTSHASGAVSGELILVTKNAGTDGEVGKGFANGSFRAGTGTALATNATGGFLLIPGSAGTPTGTPTNAAAGALPMEYDTTNHKLWVYDQPAGAWKGVVLA